MTDKPTWSQRFRITSDIIHVGALIVAALSTLIVTGATTQTIAAIAIGGVGVAIALVTQIPFTRGSWRGPASAGTGIVLYTLTIAITGGLSSSFAVLPVAAIFLAAAGGGLRVAGPAALGAIAGVLVIGVSSATNGTVDIVRVSAIYALTAIAFSEVQRAIAVESKRTAHLLLATGFARSRTEKLTTTHDLLEDLVTVATYPDINAVATAQDALRDVGVVAPNASARIVADGDIVLARRGTDQEGSPDRVVPITWEGRQLARLELWAGSIPLSPAETAALTQTVQPVGLAIDNDLLLQRLAGITIQRERVRLARELHDNIAPSVASVGLALDMVLMTGNLSSEQMRNLEATRSVITRLVDTIRDRVQDLRADRTLSILEMAHSLVAEVDADGPTVVVDIEERTPPRPAIAAEIGALLTESFRNAVTHADASIITVTGRISEAGGSLTIKDNGTGFEATSASEGRFGLLGMGERASLIGAELTIESTQQNGTIVTMTWKDDR